MHIVSIIPLTKIPLPSPQVLDYFSNSNSAAGGIAQISLNNWKVLGIVLAVSRVGEQRQAIKRASFRLKAVEQIICPREVIPKSHLQLIIWTSQYYYTPMGLAAKALLPHYFFKPTLQFLSELSMIRKCVENAPYRTNVSIVPELYKIKFLQERNKALQEADILHGGISPKKEWAIWKRVRQGEVREVLGTRSALVVAPDRLERITVYDPESPYHKSFDQQPYIHAKTVAEKLAAISGTKIDLRDVVERKSNIKCQVSNADIIDMRKELKAGNYSIFSRTLLEELTLALRRKRQAVLFISRKGLASGILCRDCGYIVKCAHCDVPMTYEITGVRPQMICRHCTRRQTPQSVCPNCRGYRIKFIGAGTQRVESEIYKLFPDASLAVLDLSNAKKWEHQEKIFQDFMEKKISILIGTQLMFKLELLPKVAFGAVVTVDPLLSLPDFRMGERAAKIIDNLAHISKKLIVQTYQPENEIFQCLAKSGPENFFDSWMRLELENRKALSFPPYSQIIKLEYAHRNFQRAEQEAKFLKNKLEISIRNLKLEIRNFQVLGPAPAFIPRVKNRYIWQIMIKSKIDDLKLRNKILSIIPGDWKVDVDPIEMV